jgi:hypothetical protein
VASRVTGQAQLRAVEARLSAAGPRLSKENAQALAKVAPDIARAIRAEVPTHLPRRNGYAALLAGDLEFQANIKVGRGMTLTVWANGKGRRRDVPRINQGVLRHPTFGRRGPDDWHDQRKGVRKGFVDDGIRKAEPLIVRSIRNAAEKVAKEIVR